MSGSLRPFFVFICLFLFILVILFILFIFEFLGVLGVSATTVVLKKKKDAFRSPRHARDVEHGSIACRISLRTVFLFGVQGDSVVIAICHGSRHFDHVLFPSAAVSSAPKLGSRHNAVACAIDPRAPLRGEKKKKERKALTPSPILGFGQCCYCCF